MPGGFDIPSALIDREGVFVVPPALVDREATGLDLIMHARSLWGVPAGAALSMAQVKLADWLMSDPVDLTIALARSGINLGGTLAGSAVVSPAQALMIHNLTGGLIRLADWTAIYSAAADAPTAIAVTAGSDAAEPSASLPEPRGRLGERMPGEHLFFCAKGEWQNRFVLSSSLGLSLALDRGSAMSAAEVLAEALGMRLVQR